MTTPEAPEMGQQEEGTAATSEMPNGGDELASLREALGKANREAAGRRVDNRELATTLAAKDEEIAALRAELEQLKRQSEEVSAAALNVATINAEQESLLREVNQAIASARLPQTTRDLLAKLPPAEAARWIIDNAGAQRAITPTGAAATTPPAAKKPPAIDPETMLRQIMARNGLGNAARVFEEAREKRQS